MSKILLLLISFLSAIVLNGHTPINLSKMGLLGSDWRVYNWIDASPTSSLYLDWLLFHNSIAFIHYFNAIVYLISNSSYNKRSFDLTHWIFCILNFPDLFHIGNYQWYTILVCNGLPSIIIFLSFNRMAVANWILRWFDKEISDKYVVWSHWIYLFGLLLAPMFEGLLRPTPIDRFKTKLILDLSL